MRVGITCYPTYGGFRGWSRPSLGRTGRARHDVHSSATPAIRMNTADRTSFFTKSRSCLPLFDHPPYTWLSPQNSKCLTPNRSTFACSLRHSAFGQRDARALHGRARRCPSSPRCTARTLLSSQQTAAISQSPAFPSSKARRNRHLQLSADADAQGFDIKRRSTSSPTSSIAISTRVPTPRNCARNGPQRRASSCTLELPPVKRVPDCVEIFALVRAKMPAKLVLIGDGPDRGAAEYLVRKKKLRKMCSSSASRTPSTKSSPRGFVPASSQLNLRLAALEAMACEVR